MAGGAGDTEEAALCKNCNAPISKMLRCGVCKAAAYCSAACQKEDWQFHKRVCKKPPVEEAKKSNPAKEAMDSEEIKRQMDELCKDKDPAMAAQLKNMMAGIMGGDAGGGDAAKPPDPLCQGCSKPCPKPLRCGVCKAATYCSSSCQKDDWRFHKRICKKPTTKPENGAGEEKKAEENTPAAPARPKGEEKVVVDDDVGTWYKHREWKPDEPRKDFAPPKVVDGDAARAAGAAPAAGGAPAAGSAWNSAGTWEEKNMLPWWQQRLQALISVSGDTLKVDKLSDVQGEASVVHVRGQPKFLYDLSLEIHFSGLQKCKACARSSSDSRCSNCCRFLGRIQVMDLSNDCEAEGPALRVQREEPSGPASVKKAGVEECRGLAEAQLMPTVRDALRDAVADYKKTVADAPKWASQLPPVAGAGPAGIAAAAQVAGATGDATEALAADVAGATDVAAVASTGGG